MTANVPYQMTRATQSSAAFSRRDECRAAQSGGWRRAGVAAVVLALANFALPTAVLAPVAVFAQDLTEDAPVFFNPSGLPTPLPQLKPELPKSAPPAQKPASLYGLPTPLGADDVVAYRHAFLGLALGDFAAVAEARAVIKDTLLMGHVLGELYTNPEAPLPDGRSLRDYLGSYPRHPQAEAVRQLAETIGERDLPEVSGTKARFKIPALESPGIYASKATSSEEDRQLFRQRIRDLLILDDYDQALDLINSADATFILDPTERDQQRAEVAAEIYYDGDDESFRRAYDLAAGSASRYGRFVPLSNWIAGLSAWRLGQWAVAERHFANCGRSVFWLSDDRAACHYWGARAALVQKQVETASQHLQNAMAFPNTLYGQLAALQLGDVPNMRFSLESLSADELARLTSWRPARRAFALIQIGEYRLAELELLMIARERDVELRRALRHLARRVGLPELAARLGHYASVKREQPNWVYADLYPRMAYEPQGGFLIDRALVLAIARKESFFRPELTNGIGAAGLMQVTPASADFLVKKGYIAPYGRVRDLTKPALNIAFAEVYLAYLLGTKIVDGDVVNLLVAYNAGIGNAKKWQARARAGGDQLLFMESLPSRETRQYVDRVLRSVLIYRLKFKQSRDDFLRFSEGGALGYVSQDRAGVPAS